MTSRIALAAALLLAAAGCSRGPATGDADPGAPTWEEMAGASYRGLIEAPVRLEDGRWEGAPYVPDGASRPAAGLAEGFRLAGDLDGNGAEEAVGLLWTSTGGSGNRIHLAVVARIDGKPVNRAAALVGDRVQVRSGAIEGGTIRLDVVQAGPGDAACCPTQTATRRWRLDGEALQELPAEAMGTLSLRDLEGVEWVLAELAPDDPVPAEPAVTLTFQEGQVAGSSGCNRYFAGATPGAGPADLEIGPVAGTRMACPEPAMGLESRYLEALAGTTRFSFLAGTLVLDWTSGERSGRMRFRSRPPEPVS